MSVLVTPPTATNPNPPTPTPNPSSIAYHAPQVISYRSWVKQVNIYLNVSAEIDQTLQRGKKFENSYYLVPFSVYYTGEWKRGRPHGVGDVVFQNGSILRASFVNGEVKGQDCLLIMPDGSYYRGCIERNMFCGKGVFKEQNGHSYQGDWMDNMPDGKGQQKFANGDKFSGNYQNGKKNGQGLYEWNNHMDYVSYFGQFKDDYMNGRGTLTKRNETKISGIFQKNSISEAFVRNRQFIYEGSIKNGVLDGQGKLKYLINKKNYQGQFKNGQPHGYGVITYENGQSKQGYFFKGNLLRSYKGIQQAQLQKCIKLVERQLEKNIYLQDVIQEINQSFNSMGMRNVKAEAVPNTSQTQTYNFDRYFAVDIGDKSILIHSNN